MKFLLDLILVPTGAAVRLARRLRMTSDIERDPRLRIQECVRTIVGGSAAWLDGRYEDARFLDDVTLDDKHSSEVYLAAVMLVRDLIIHFVDVTGADPHEVLETVARGGRRLWRAS